MKAKFATLLLFAAFITSPALAQNPAPAPSKPSMLSRMKAAATPKAPAAKPVASAPAKPMAATNKGQAPRTAKSLDCSKQADAKNIHGKDRKSFMSHCKRA